MATFVTAFAVAGQSSLSFCDSISLVQRSATRIDSRLALESKIADVQASAIEAKAQDIFTATADDWALASCPAGSYLVGGGCSATSGGYVFQASEPSGEDPTTSQWSCGGHGGSKSATAVCSARIRPYYKVATGGDWTHVACDEGDTVIGGGCSAEGSPYKFKYSGPGISLGSNTSWTCGGFGGSKRVTAICASGVTPTVKQNQAGDWTQATCDAGQELIGGGCSAEGSPYYSSTTAPKDETTWQCGGHGGGKIAWAICADASLLEMNLDLEYHTCDRAHANTDGRVNLQIDGGEWTKLDAPHNDRERNQVDTFNRLIPPCAKSIAIETESSDGWCMDSLKVGGQLVSDTTYWFDKPCDPQATYPGGECKTTMEFTLPASSKCTEAPTTAPTMAPTTAPTPAPTAAPTPAPTAAPTLAPTNAPTAAPTTAPTLAPTTAPTLAPTAAPTLAPTAAPTLAPTDAPTAAPTTAPTTAPTPEPTPEPTTAAPTTPLPTFEPTEFSAALRRRYTNDSCKAWCVNMDAPWDKRCYMAKCKGCIECTEILSGCKGWCAKSQKSWADKCTYESCLHCSECSNL